MEPRIKVKTFTLSRAELERYLISLGEPEDIVITNIQRPVNQEVWLISAQSSEYAPMHDYSLSPTSKNDLLKENL